MKNLYKILADENKRRGAYLEKPAFYGKKLKRRATDLYPEAKVFIFGSAVKGEQRADSDLDILVVTKEAPSDVFQQAEAKLKMAKDFPHHPFEIHLITPKQFENWYQRFIKSEYLEM